jgi:multiple sugar transport system ATP-binding protein
MGDRVAVMSMGKLQQVDTPQHLYDEPFNMFVASFIGTPPMNLVEADVAVEGERVDVKVGPTTITAGASALARYPQIRNCDGRRVVLGIRAEDLHPGADRPAFPTFNGRIDLVEALGSGLMAYFTIDAVPVRTQAHVEMEAESGVTNGDGNSESVVSGARPNLIAAFPPRVQLRIGDSVPVAVDPDNIHFFDLETGAALR